MKNPTVKQGPQKRSLKNRRGNERTAYRARGGKQEPVTRVRILCGKNGNQGAG